MDHVHQAQPVPAYAKVPPFLRGLRERGADLTQRQLAARIRKPQWWVARIETGSPLGRRGRVHRVRAGMWG